jgi:hypothetical protein
MASSNSTPPTILFLAANPQSTNSRGIDSRGIDREIRDLRESLQRKEKRFLLELRLAVRPEDIHQALLEVKPQIVHFSGHGRGTEGLVLENHIGRTQLLQGEVLARLFALFVEHIHCVLLNCCYSQEQAELIAKHIPYVIGMNGEITNKEALAFSQGFYDALGSGQDPEFAYQLGCTLIDMQRCTLIDMQRGQDEKRTPILLQGPTTKILPSSSKISPSLNIQVNDSPLTKPSDSPDTSSSSSTHKTNSTEPNRSGSLNTSPSSVTNQIELPQKPKSNPSDPADPTKQIEDFQLFVPGLHLIYPQGMCESELIKVEVNSSFNVRPNTNSQFQLNVNITAEPQVDQTTTQISTIPEDLKTIQGLLKNLIQDMLDEVEIEFGDPKETKRLAKELEKAEAAFAELEQVVAQGETELSTSTQSRIGEFIDNLADENSRINKALKLVSKGTKKLQELGQTYNKIAPYFTLPAISPILLGSSCLPPEEMETE